MSTIDSLYPPSITNAPPGLAQPSAAYRRSVITVLTGLLLFLALYLFLVIASGHLVYLAITYPLTGDGRGDYFLKFICVAMSVMLFLFLVKGLFKRRTGDDPDHVEIKPSEHPELFAFIQRLCQEAGAPAPYRVFLSYELNAAVFYNSSLLNLLIPVRKNLLIGLALVNGLNLSEFKAVLAHEYGHFSQKSMRLGNYVYIANSVIGDMVYGRDRWDDWLAKWQRSDLRLAIFGWILGAVVWILRKILQLAFHLLNLTRSQLSLQQEFHADRVAVSLTGSDALIHALKRLGFLSECLSQALQDLRAAHDEGRYSRDLFFHQTAAAAHVRRAAGDPQLGTVPPLPPDASAATRLFQPTDHEIPEMYATHPPSYLREEHAKEIYLRSPIDERSPWILFRDPAALRERVTRLIYEHHFDLPANPVFEDPAALQTFIDEERLEMTFDQRYHGIFDERFVGIEDLDSLAQGILARPWEPPLLAAAWGRIYGGQLKDLAEGLRARRRDFETLSGIQSGSLKPQGGVFSFRGTDRTVREVPALIGTVSSEIEADVKRLDAFDREVFQAHYLMASRLGDDSLAELFHRYRFLLAAQEIYRKVRDMERELHTLLAQLQSQGSEISNDQFQAALGSLRRFRQTLADCLTAAGQWRLPPLANVQPGMPYAQYLLGEPLLSELPADAKSLDGEWITKLLKQTDRIETRARRVHFKCLGAILALQEKIAAAWRASAAPSAPPPPATN